MKQILSMSFYIVIGIYFFVASYGSEDKAVELLFCLIGTVWIMYGIIINTIKDLSRKLDNTGN